MSESVVVFSRIEPGIAQITMNDRMHKNSFTDEFLDSLAEAFRKVEADTTLKVVILTGYDNYFSCGGTQELLLEIQEGKKDFTSGNRKIYSLALECRIPVISAMQGHAIGGGFALGLFADFIILSMESIYTTNFMKYGFTPGMGATFIVTNKLGIGLAEEMLISARNYRGAELRQKGIPFPVLPRHDIAAYALELAREIAEKPRVSLVTLKDHLVGKMRAELPGVIADEVAMHKKTFTQSIVRDKILDLYDK